MVTPSQSLQGYENLASTQAPGQTFSLMRGVKSQPKPASTSCVNQHMLWAVGLALFTTACPSKEEPKGEAPPEPAVAVCAEPGGAKGSVSGMPERAAGHCVDHATDLRSYGTGAPLPLDAVCVELFNGECELYKRYGLESVKTLAYAPQSGEARRVSAVMSEFSSLRGAYGFLTHRVLGAGVPSQATVAPVLLEGHGVLGAGVGYVQRGKRVVELTYLSETETPDEIEKRSSDVLLPLLRAIASELGGPTELPEEARLVSLQGLDALGILVGADGLLEVTGTGPYALGFYSGHATPHRIVAMLSLDEVGARDQLRLLLRRGASNKLKGTNVHSLTVAFEGRDQENWFLTQSDRVVYGVGPALMTEAEGVLTPKMRAQEREAWKTFAVERLAEVVRRGAAQSLGGEP